MYFFFEFLTKSKQDITDVISIHGKSCLNYVRLWNNSGSGLVFIFFDSALLELLVEFGETVMIDGTWKLSGDRMQVVTIMIQFSGSSKVEKNFSKPPLS